MKSHLLFIGKKPTRKQYHIRIILGWVYTLIWIFTLVSIYFFFEISLTYKIIINIVLVFGLPTLSDLFVPYSKFIAKHFVDK